MSKMQISEKIRKDRAKFKRVATQRHGYLAWQDAIVVGTGVTVGDLRNLFGPHPENVSVKAYQKIANFLGFKVTSKLGWTKVKDISKGY